MIAAIRSRILGSVNGGRARAVRSAALARSRSRRA
jgi:hypothetical protein